MDGNQLHFIFDGRDTTEAIKKEFDMISCTSNFKIMVERYSSILIDYDHNLVIIADENDTKDYIDFTDIDGVHERLKFSNEYMRQVSVHMSR